MLLETAVVTALHAVALALAPPASALESHMLPLPNSHTVAYRALRSLNSASFSTHVGGSSVLGIQDIIGPPPTCSLAGSEANLQLFLSNNDQCVDPGDDTTYALYTQNIGQQTAYNVEIFYSPPGQVLNSEGQQSFDTFPGGFTSELSFTSTVPSVPATATAGVTYQTCPDLHEEYECKNDCISQCPLDEDGPEGYDEACVNSCLSSCRRSHSTSTSHTLDNTCTTPPPRPGDDPPPSKGFAAIICDISETTCQAFFPSLGQRFEQAKDPVNQPVICADNVPQTNAGREDCVPNTPVLGSRFAEAIADINPGECSVIYDKEVIVTPEYHDAFLRKNRPAAPHLQLLYESGEDFKQLVHDNALIEIPFMAHAYQVLRTIHTEEWIKRIDPLQNVLSGTLSTDDIRARIEPWNQEWIERTKEAQQQLAIDYGAMQEEKKPGFDPIAAQAIANARASIAASCNAQSDGGLAAAMPRVKITYESNLEAQRTEFDEVQTLFVSPNSPIFPDNVQAQTWQQELRDALDAFDAGDPDPLTIFIDSIPLKDQIGFSTAWSLTYGKKQQADEGADTSVRLTSWDVALDEPKRIVTECEYEKVAPPPVETSWCESGDSREAVDATALAHASQKIKQDAQPPNTASFNGLSDTITDALVEGEICSGNPGDPWWASDCSCHCGQIVGSASCQQVKEITKLDINVTSPEECLNEGTKHDDTPDI